MPIFVRAILANQISRILMIVLIPVSTFLVIMLARPGIIFGYGYYGSALVNLVVWYVFFLEVCVIASVVLVGQWTCDFYICAIKHIEEHKKIDKRFARKMSAPCQRAGLRLAAKDTGCQIDIS